MVSIRKFLREDIPKKVEWINNPENNGFLHYDIPLCEEKTEIWYDNIKDKTDRYDAVIEYDGIPCGTIGLLCIDRKNSKAEFYIAMGETSLKGKGIASEATELLLNYAFCTLGLNRVYLFTETKNIPAQRLFEKVGFAKEGLLEADVLSHGDFADRYAYGLVKSKYLERKNNEYTD